jgi:hypothetical protein
MTSSKQSPSRDWIATYDADDPDLRAAIHRRNARIRWITVPAVVVAVVATSNAPIPSGGSDLDETFYRVPASLVWLVTVLFVVASAMIVAGIAIALRPARRTAVRRNPRPVLSRAQSRRVGKQLAGQVPVAPHEMPFLRDVALGTYASRWGVVTLAGIVLLCAARATVYNNDADAVRAGVVGLILAVVCALGLRGVVQARRFLKSVGVAPV